MTSDTFSCVRLENFPPYKPSNQQAWYLPPDAVPLKLDWNESPLPPSPKVMEAVRAFLAQPNAFNWYPDADSGRLREAIGVHWGIPAACVQTYCGSDSALQSAVRIFTRVGDKVLMVSPTYDNFRIYAMEAECQVVLDGPQDIYTLTGADVDALIQRHNPRLVYLANPNNPTGWLVPETEVVALAARYPDVMLLVDEAYAEYAGQSLVTEATRRPNLLVARTFSKAYGLAGLRIGYVATSQGNIEQLNLIRNGKNVSMLGQVAALAAMQDAEGLAATLACVADGRQLLVDGLTRLGIPHRATPANFLLMQLEDAPRVQSELAKRHIYIRSMSHLKGMTGYLRITLGSREQMRRLVDAMAEILNSRP